MNTSDPVYLFLDFDGVLHHFFPRSGKSDAENARWVYIPAFEAAVRACTRPVQIVITSTLRHKIPLVEIRGLFSPDIAQLIVGTTPKRDDANKPGGRLREVLAWLEDGDLLDSDWVGVDDYPVLYGGNAAVVKCEDHFTDHEHALLVEAVADPKAYAKAHPIQLESGLIIVTGVDNRN